ncbi:hypothetical protein HMPREF0072_1532 [Anaerococcus lactolyticus ATCC 51172]|uniref:Uncharacterized protein n=1 Tax=Anaerococcus lactolyticus ATCC 51172 TaxID=525254 RepID=C2BGR2_9FIRM|nr:hypothetical protein HMPREF0072_1532 [Anaerococcus lactolyticus ATCC 51172]
MLSIKIKEYNSHVIIALISMRGGETMRLLLDIIFAVVIQIIGNYLYKWLESKLNKDDN